MKQKKENKKYFIISVISLAVFILFWELLTDILHLLPEKKTAKSCHNRRNFYL